MTCASCVQTVDRALERVPGRRGRVRQPGDADGDGAYVLRPADVRGAGDHSSRRCGASVTALGAHTERRARGGRGSRLRRAPRPGRAAHRARSCGSPSPLPMRAGARSSSGRSPRRSCSTAGGRSCAAAPRAARHASTTDGHAGRARLARRLRLQRRVGRARAARPLLRHGCGDRHPDPRSARCSRPGPARARGRRQAAARTQAAKQATVLVDGDERVVPDRRRAARSARRRAPRRDDPRRRGRA